MDLSAVTETWPAGLRRQLNSHHGKKNKKTSYRPDIGLQHLKGNARHLYAHAPLFLFASGFNFFRSWSLPKQQLKPFYTWHHVDLQLKSRCLELTPAQMGLILEAPTDLLCRFKLELPYTEGFPPSRRSHTCSSEQHTHTRRGVGLLRYWLSHSEVQCQETRGERVHHCWETVVA